MKIRKRFLCMKKIRKSISNKINKKIEKWINYQ